MPKPTDPVPPESPGSSSPLMPGDRVVVLASNRPGSVLDGRCGPNGRIVVLPDRIASERHGVAVVVVERVGVRPWGDGPTGQTEFGIRSAIEPSVIELNTRDHTGETSVLVLNRQPGERIVIDTGTDRIEVQVVEIRGFAIRIGITAPPHVRVDREEVRRRIDR